jgi:hypothetical protein
VIARNGLRNTDGVSPGYRNPFGVSAIACQPEHLVSLTKLLAEPETPVARAIAHDVVNADAFPDPVAVDGAAGALDHAGDLVPERDGQDPGGGVARSVVGIGVADSCGLDTNNHLVGAGLRHGKVDRFER